MGVVMEISDHIVVLDYGVKISDGDAVSVKADPKVIAAYLGVDDEEMEQQPEAAAIAAEALDAAAPSPVPTLSPAGDDLTRIRGIGPVNARKLADHGVTSFAQIAAWTKADIMAAEAYLEFDGRIEREDWMGQARDLAAGARGDGR